MFEDSEQPKPEFDSDGNMVDAQGHVLVPSHVFDSYLPGVRRPRPAQQLRGERKACQMVPSSGVERWLTCEAAANEMASASITAAANHIAARMQGPRALRSQGGQASSPPSQPHSSAFASPTVPSPSPHAHSPGRDSRQFARNTSLVPGDGSHDGLGGGLAIPGTNNTYSSATAAAPAPAHAYTASAQSLWVPQDYTSGPTGSSLGFDSSSSAYPADDGPWLPTEQPGLVYEQSQSLPPRPRNPAIRVTTDFSGAPDFSQPQDATYSASSAASSLPPHDYIHYNNYHSGHLSPQRPHFMPQDPETMQTPVSPVSAHSPQDASMGEQVSRKRSHSVMSHQDVTAIANAAHSRSGSLVSATGASPNEASDDYYPKRLNSRAFKRGDPPMNGDNKYICDFAEECRGQTFDRKCEWSKHMDKHDRPYRCPHPSCAKLQGFTYSGGLLRHEREVHGKHGGPKAQLMCPHPDCKRHSGKGFTRKENLNEHLRRVHPTGGQESQNSSLRRDNTDITLGLEDGETPASRISEPAGQDDLATSPMLGKRKRDGMFPLDSDSIDDLESMRQEVKRLRAEAEQKDERIRQMEAAAEEHEKKTQHLETLLNMQQLQQEPNQG